MTEIRRYVYRSKRDAMRVSLAGIQLEDSVGRKIRFDPLKGWQRWGIAAFYGINHHDDNGWMWICDVTFMGPCYLPQDTAALLLTADGKWRIDSEQIRTLSTATGDDAGLFVHHNGTWHMLPDPPKPWITYPHLHLPQPHQGNI